MTKKEIRNIVRQDIKSMTKEERDKQSEYVCQMIISSEQWMKAEIVLLYSAMEDEISLLPLFEDAQKSGKQIILPVMEGDTLIFREFNPGQLSIENQFHIEEPTSKCRLFTEFQRLNLAIIPGRAFTLEGERMGRGKGFYDRILPHISCPKWGVAFSCQIKDTLPTDPWDILMDSVLFMRH